MTIQLVIFDCDGVLIDSEVLYLRAEFEFLASKGINVDRDWYVGEFMALGNDKWRNKLSDLLIERTGSGLTDTDYDGLKDRSRTLVMNELAIVPDVHEMLQSLPLPRCVASSTLSHFLSRKLDQVELGQYFGSGVFSGDQVENGKPAPDLFLLAAHQMGFGPEQCLVVEDSANGVRGGKAAGMQVIGFLGGSHVDEKHGNRLQAAGADHIISDHRALSDWFQQNL